MNETIEAVRGLSPIGAFLVIAGVAASALTQLAKQPGMSKRTRTLVFLGVAALVGVVGWLLVAGVTAGIPERVVETASSIIVAAAGVVVVARWFYGTVAKVVPDGGTATDAAPTGDDALTITSPAPADETPLVDIAAARSDALHGRRADRDGQDGPAS